MVYQLLESFHLIILFIMNLATILTAALLLSCVFSVRIFLFGGILVDDQNPAYAKLAQETGKPTRKNCDQNWETTDCPKVAVITSACYDAQCSQEEYYDGDGEEVATGKFFQDLGMAPRHFAINVDNYKQTTNWFHPTGATNILVILDADIIYFNGGDQSRHMRCMFNDDGQPNPFFTRLRNRVLNNQAIVVGVSAGTTIQSKYSYGGGSSFGILYFTNSLGLAPLSISQNEGMVDSRTGTESLQYQENGGVIQGFGFVDFFVDTHFNRRGRLGRMIPALSQLNQTLGIGIDQYACLFYNDGVGTIYGRNGAFIADLTAVPKSKSTYFQIRNAKVHYLTAGDSFNFKTKKMTSNKTPISSPSLNGFADSQSILSQYECSRLVTRLVDQKASENLGKTVVPYGEDYPSDTPTFDILFYKNAETKGYKQGNAVSAQNVSVDFSAQVRNAIA